MSGNLVCSMPRCQTTAGCICVDWVAWAANHRSGPYYEGYHGVRASNNPYLPGTWQHEQWLKGLNAEPVWWTG